MQLRLWTRARLGCAALSAAALAACGGGGGGHHHGNGSIVVPSGARVEAASRNSDVSPDNFDTLAGPMARLVASSGGSPAEGSLKTDRNAAATAARAARPTVTFAAVSQLLRHVAADLKPASASASSAGRAQTQAVSNRTFSCDGGGSLTMSTDDVDNDGGPSPGDTVTATFTDCQLDATALPAGGRFTFTIDDIDFNGRGDVAGLIVEGVFDGLSVGDAVTLDGAFTAWQTIGSGAVENYRFSYGDVRAVSLGETTTYNVDVEGVFDPDVAGVPVDTFAIDGAISLRGQTFKIVQGADWFSASGSAYPDRGTLYLQDIEGDTLSLQALPSQRLDFEFIPQGSSAPTFVWRDRRWSDFGT